MLQLYFVFLHKNTKNATQHIHEDAQRPLTLERGPYHRVVAQQKAKIKNHMYTTKYEYIFTQIARVAPNNFNYICVRNTRLKEKRKK